MYLNSTLEHECWVILTHTMNKYHLVVMANRIFMVKKKKIKQIIFSSQNKCFCVSLAHCFL